MVQGKASLMAVDAPKALKEWRELRGLSEEDLAHLVGADARTVRSWEHLGYDPAAQCGLALAAALSAPVDAIVFGHYIRGLVLPRSQFLVAARGRDDLGWRARIVEWHIAGPVDARHTARANAGWLVSGASAAGALDRLERELRAAFHPAR